MEIFVPPQVESGALKKLAHASRAKAGAGLHDTEGAHGSAAGSAFDALLSHELTRQSAEQDTPGSHDEGALSEMPATGTLTLTPASLTLPPAGVYAQSVVSGLTHDAARFTEEHDIEAGPAKELPEATVAMTGEKPGAHSPGGARDALASMSDADETGSAAKAADRGTHIQESHRTMPAAPHVSGGAAAPERARGTTLAGAPVDVSHARDAAGLVADALTLQEAADTARAWHPAPATPVTSAHEARAVPLRQAYPAQAVTRHTEKIDTVAEAWSIEAEPQAAAVVAHAAAAPGTTSRASIEPAARSPSAGTALNSHAAGVTTVERTASASLTENSFTPLSALEVPAPAAFVTPERAPSAAANPATEPAALQVGQLSAQVTPAQASVTNPLSPADAPVGARVETPFGSQGWGNAFAGRIVWLAGEGEQVARLHLNPPELGPVAVTLHVNADEASARFVASHVAVREAIEASLPRLREMLAENGISLGQAEVSAQSSGQPAREGSRFFARSNEAGADMPGTSSGQESGARPGRVGLVDTFA